MAERMHASSQRFQFTKKSVHKPRKPIAYAGSPWVIAKWVHTMPVGLLFTPAPRGMRLKTIVHNAHNAHNRKLTDVKLTT